MSHAAPETDTTTPVENLVETEVKKFLTPTLRLWLYGVCIAAMPLLVAYGKLSGDQVSIWTDFLSAVLGVSGLTVAVANVKR